MEISLPIQQGTAPILPTKGFKMDAFESLIQPPEVLPSGFYPVNPRILRLGKREFFAFATLLKYRNRASGTAFLHPNAIGCSTRQYNRIMSHLVGHGLIRKVGERLYSIAIHDEKGALFPCFSRFFWERFSLDDYLEFRFTTFLGLTSRVGTRFTAREIQAGLRCRMAEASPLAELLAKDTRYFAHIQASVRFRNKEWGRGVLNYPRPFVSESIQTTPKIAVSEASGLIAMNSPNLPDFVSEASPLTRKIQEEELTRDQPAFFEVENFSQVGFPEYPFRISVKMRPILNLQEYTDLLKPHEIAFLISLSIYLLSQSFFRSVNQDKLAQCLVNAYLLVKSRISKIKLNRTPMDYFCGTLRILIQEDRPPSEITRLRDLASLSRIKSVNEAHSTHTRFESTSRIQEKAMELGERVKPLIPGWEAMSPMALNMLIIRESIEGGRFAEIRREVMGLSHATH